MEIWVGKVTHHLHARVYAAQIIADNVVFVTLRKRTVVIHLKMTGVVLRLE